MSHWLKTLRVCLDLVIFALICFVEYAVQNWLESQRRGFFCNDDSLRYPLLPSSISTILLVSLVTVLPCLVILATELCRGAKPGRSTGVLYRLQQCYRHVGCFLFGLGLTVITTGIAKCTLGRLRPNFFAACAPVLPDGSTCDDIANHGRYILDYSCTAPNATASLLRDITRSFPSAHSSMLFYSMLYMCCYLQDAFSTRASKLLKHLLQFVFLMVALYGALSRIADYWHHWSDVLAGAVLGSLFAIMAAVFITDLFKRNGCAHLKAVTVAAAPAATPSSAASSGSLCVKSGPTAKVTASVLPAYTFGTIPYLHPAQQYGQTYQNYGYVP